MLRNVKLFRDKRYIPDNKLLLYLCAVFLAISAYIDLWSLYKQKKYGFIQQQATIDKHLQHLQTGYIHLINQLNKAIAPNKNHSEQAILQSIRKYYTILEKTTHSEWVNIAWYDENNAMFINQLGIAHYPNKSEHNNLFSYCKPLVYSDNTVNGRVCIEFSFKALESYLSELLSEDVLLFENDAVVSNHQNKKVFMIQFFNTPAWVLLPNQSIFSQFNIEKYIYFLMGSSIVVLIIRRHKRQLIRQDRERQQMIEALANEKSVYSHLLQYHHGANPYDLIQREMLDLWVNTFDWEIRALNINIVISINEAVYQHPINIFALQTLLLHFIGNAISNLQREGEISIQLHVEDEHWIHCVYSDNGYVLDEENSSDANEEKQSDSLQRHGQCFQLTHEQLIRFIERHHIDIVTEVSKYQGKQIMMKFPLDQTPKEDKEYNVVTMFDMEEL